MQQQLSLLSQFAEPGKWWPPDTLPTLDSRYKKLWVDEETTGLNPYTDQPVAFSFMLEDGRKYCLPFAFAGGGNLDQGLVFRWMLENLRGKDLTWINARYGVHVWRNVGISFEDLGCTIHDVAFQAALLDERRRRFNLDELCGDVLGRQKDTSVHKSEKNIIAELHSSLVGPYAEQDAVDVHDLDVAMRTGLGSLLPNTIDGDDQNRVLDLEDSIIYAVAEMERNGAIIDRPKLEGWIKEASYRLQQMHYDLTSKVKFKVNPNSPDDMVRLFKYLGLTWQTTAKGAPSFDEIFLKSIKNETVQQILKSRKMASLLTTLKKYLNALDHKNILRYSLHQLRANDDDKGTISGRFSAAAPGSLPGANIQQVPRVKKQIKNLGPDYIIRELFIAPPERLYLAADAMQIEFRFFAHYANSPKLLQAYRDNPLIDFHDMVRDMIRRLIPDFDRDPAKTINFAKVYGAGRDKISLQLELDRRESDKFVDVYDEEFPEAGKLLRTVTNLAERRNYVKTFLGRRARFIKPSAKDPKARMMEEIAYKPHSALNRVLQGGAADYMKTKIREVHLNRRLLDFTQRMVVHDEYDGDTSPDPEKAKLMEECLNTQSYPELRVPILWDVGTGANWREAKGD